MNTADTLGPTPFDPGKGWREVRDGEYPETGLIRWTPDDPATPERYWVRVEPMPPLPTEPYTVIRMTPPDGSPPALYVHDGQRMAFVSPNAWIERIDARCTVEVLARPTQGTIPVHKHVELAAEVRRETAKAVLDRVQRELDEMVPGDPPELDDIAREFGVE